MLYDCISTGEERGLLQVVLNAKTLGNILTDATDKQSSDVKVPYVTSSHIQQLIDYLLLI